MARCGASFHRHKITREEDRARHEQDRPHTVKRREPDGKLESRSESHVFYTRPHPTPVAVADRAEMAEGSESAFLRALKATTFVAGLHLNGIVAPVVLDGPTNGSAFERPSADSDLTISVGEMCSVSSVDDSVLRRK
jgi:hypothetical protein